MPSLPLYYLGLEVGHALVDPPLAELPSTLKWGLAIPHTIRRMHKNRADVLLCLLREDPSLLPRCSPLAQVRLNHRSLNLRLSRLALFPQVVPVLQNLLCSANEALMDDVRSLTLFAPPIRFLNNNRCDCRLANLRVCSVSDDGSVSLVNSLPL